jgi:hypothetical protein
LLKCLFLSFFSILLQELVNDKKKAIRKVNKMMKMKIKIKRFNRIMSLFLELCLNTINKVYTLKKKNYQKYIRESKKKENRMREGDEARINC